MQWYTLQVHLAMYTCNDPPDLLFLIILHLAATSPAPAAYTGHFHLQCLAPIHLITLSPYHLNLVQVPGALRSWHVDVMGHGMLRMFNPCMQISVMYAQHHGQDTRRWWRSWGPGVQVCRCPDAGWGRVPDGGTCPALYQECHEDMSTGRVYKTP